MWEALQTASKTGVETASDKHEKKKKAAAATEDQLDTGKKKVFMEYIVVDEIHFSKPCAVSYKAK